MTKVVPILICLFCAGHGRRMQTKAPRLQSNAGAASQKALNSLRRFPVAQSLAEVSEFGAKSAVTPMQAMRLLLLTQNPVAAFRQAALDPAGLSSRSAAQPLLSQSQTRLGTVTPLMSANDLFPSETDPLDTKKLPQPRVELGVLNEELKLEQPSISIGLEPSATMAAPAAPRVPRDLSMNEQADLSINQQAGVIGLSPMRRNIISAVALAGAIETLWLTLEKLEILGDSSVCTSEACSLVLGGPYAYVGDIPLAAFGAIAYLAVAALAQAPDYDFSFEWNEDKLLKFGTKHALAAVTSSMAAFSVYLMALLAFVIKAACPFCIASAVFSITNAGLVWWEGGLLLSLPILQTSLAATFLTTILSSVLFVKADTPTALTMLPAVYREKFFSRSMQQELNEYSEFKSAFQEKRTPKIMSASSKRAIFIAKRLKKKGAVMYGAFWCSHCFDQKNTFGREAMEMLQYKECGREAANTQEKLCEAKGIKVFPTWEIGGKLYGGEKPLDKFEEILSGKAVKDSTYDPDFVGSEDDD